MTMHIPTFTGPMTLPVFPTSRRELLLRVIAERADHHIVARRSIWSRSRNRRAAHARQDVWLDLHEAGWTLKEIAAPFGRDHTTVMHGIKAARARRAEA